jgi:predicted XRE-type DNA-binding protein
VLHAFQKKSKHGIATQRPELELIETVAQVGTRGLRAMVKKQEVELPVTPSSGNVFEDLGFPEPEEELTKAQLASHIRQVIKRRRLTHVAAATLMGIDQPKVSALLNGRLANFSSDRLMRLLTALGQDIEIVVRAKPRDRDRGRISVVDHTHV